MSFLLRWLGLDAPLRDARLRPYRRFESAVDVTVVRERARRAMKDILGATITRDEDEALEGAIGLVDGERIFVRFESTGDNRTSVTIESVRPLGVAPRAHSAYVDRLAGELEKG